MSLSRLSSSQSLYAQYGRYSSHEKPGTWVEALAWRLEYKSRRYHEFWQKKRGRHGHRGPWEDCHTIACEEDRALLEHFAR